MNRTMQLKDRVKNIAIFIPLVPFKLSPKRPLSELCALRGEMVFLPQSVHFIV